MQMLVFPIMQLTDDLQEFGVQGVIWLGFHGDGSWMVCGKVKYLGRSKWVRNQLVDAYA
jgi:hypothetical protein